MKQQTRTMVLPGNPRELGRLVARANHLDKLTGGGYGARRGWDDETLSAHLQELEFVTVALEAYDAVRAHRGCPECRPGGKHRDTA